MPHEVHCARLLTPPGMGAIGVVRVEGADPWRLVAPLLRSAKREARPLSAALVPGRVVYVSFVDDEEVIDDCLITTVTTGDGYAIDIAAHGGVRILERILQALARQGVTIEPVADSAASVWQGGTRLEAEIIDALGEAKTELAVRFLAYQRAHLLDHLQSVASLCESEVEAAERALTALIGRSLPARFLVEGATIAIVGPPNAGKSSLFNRLVGREAAVVSETPGTTRDWVSADLDWLGVPVHLIDTAGSRETTDALEAEAISSGVRQGQAADAVLVVLDGTDPAGVEAWCARLRDEPSNQPRMVVLNKSDCRDASIDDSRVRDVCDSWASVSATSGNGIDSLIAEAVTTLGVNPEEMLRPALITRRQVQAAEAIQGQLRKHPHQAARSIRGDLIGL